MLRMVFLSSLLVVACSSKQKSAPESDPAASGTAPSVDLSSPEVAAPSKGAPATGEAPDQKSARATLLAKGDLMLNADRHLGCESQSVADYVDLLETQGGQGDIHSLKLTCKAAQDDRFLIELEEGADDYWFCSYDAHSSDKEGVSPWNYSLQFLISKATGALELEHFACPGA